MDGYITEFGGAKDLYFRRNIFVKRDDDFEKSCSNFVNEFNNNDIYYSVFSYENEDIDNCLLYGPLYLDLDSEISTDEDYIKMKVDVLLLIDRLREEFGIPPEMVQVYFSGSKGFHILIAPEIIGVTPHKDLNEHYRVLAIALRRSTVYKTIDTRIYDRRRLFRMPNSINAKTGLYKVPVPLNILRQSDIDSICEWASQPREIEFSEPMPIERATIYYNGILRMVEQGAAARKANRLPVQRNSSNEPREILPCVRHALENGIDKGARNNTMVAIASALFQHGMKLEQVIDALLAWNSLNSPPLDDKEIYTTARSAHTMFNDGRTYGCAAFKDLDLCVGDECRICNP